MRSSPLASRSVQAHYVRGAVGLLALAAACLGPAAGVPAAFALVLVTLVAWRGCPTCWAVGLVHTREHAACADGRCARWAGTTTFGRPRARSPSRGSRA